MTRKVCMFPIGNVGAKGGVGAAVLRRSVIGFNTSFYTQMPRRMFLTLEEAVEMVLADDSAQAADVVLLPSKPNEPRKIPDNEEVHPCIHVRVTRWQR
ncbi:hypothetical protein HPB48_014708 [Haemaphysalis longicornis]|uniref:Uncharacterized protein n=1 Tax=Haemaphysalis longicornis TaxID=44386 RepID=A0A9J6GNN8_HAELO|nr:hypothetical protein HPB48_014708 [Haemaphysalis longicornis]